MSGLLPQLVQSAGTVSQKCVLLGFELLVRSAGCSESAERGHTSVRPELDLTQYRSKIAGKSQL